MNSVLRYGTAASISLEIPPEKLVAACGQPHAESLDDPAAAVAAALIDPLEFPPLAQAIVPGDRVVVAVQPGVPQSPAIIGGTIQLICEAGADPGNVVLLLGAEDASSDDDEICAELPADLASLIKIVIHDPNDDQQLAYLAMDSKGNPVYVNRELQDADFVVPIGRLRVDSASGYYGTLGGLFPVFGDQAAQERFRSPRNELIAAGRQRRRAEVEEVGWLLGVIFSIQVVPGAGGTVLHVLAGSVPAVAQQGNRLCQAAWVYQVPRRADLVIAGVEGDPGSQTWENVGRAAAAALEVTGGGGAIAICTELAAPPGDALRQLANGSEYEAIRHALQKETSVDALPALQLLQAMDQTQVYLLSRLDDDLVEDLGMAPVGGVDEVLRLGRNHDSCIVLANAQDAVASPQA